jgi:hypothetical protein
MQNIVLEVFGAKKKEKKIFSTISGNISLNFCFDLSSHFLRVEKI